MIRIIDVTNRDGVQAHGIYISHLERTMINIYLNRAGIYQSEFGFPVIPNERSYLQANLNLAKKGVISPMILEGWVRASVEDVEKALEIEDLKHLNISISTSDVMLQRKLRKSEQEVISMMVDAVKAAKEGGIETVGVNAEDASRTRHYEDQSYLEDFAVAAKEAGADRIRYCDTLGCDLTHTIRDRVKRLAEKVQLPIELHCHNDIGYAVANSVEGAIGALEAGVDAYINTTVNGYGERAGNADLVSVLLAIKYSSGLRRKRKLLDPHIKMSKMWSLCDYASLAMETPIPPNQPGVGSNAFSHESGIHADGMMKDRRNYELFAPGLLGIPKSRVVETGRQIVVGDYSGKRALAYVCEKYGIGIEDSGKLLDLVQRATKAVKRRVTADELRFIAEHPEEAEMVIRN